MCIAVGSTLGGLIPMAWGAGAFGLAAILGSAAGGAAGVWVAARLGA